MNVKIIQCFLYYTIILNLICFKRTGLSLCAPFTYKNDANAGPWSLSCFPRMLLFFAKSVLCSQGHQPLLQYVMLHVVYLMFTMFPYWTVTCH